MQSRDYIAKWCIIRGEYTLVMQYEELHNLTEDNVIFCYREGDTDSIEVAHYYKSARNLSDDHLIPLPCSSDNIITYEEYLTQIEDPLLDAIASLSSGSGSVGPSSSGGGNIWVIILGYNVPHVYQNDDPYELLAIASRLHRLGKSVSPKSPNFTYDRRGAWQYFDEEDAKELYITAIIDGPTVNAAKKLIDRSIDVDNQPFVTGKIYIDPYGKQTTESQLDYQSDILDWVQNSVNDLDLEREITVDIQDPYQDPLTSYFNNDSFYWGWYTPRYSRLLFLNQNERRVFLYNADDDGAADISQLFDPNGSDPWCNIAINIEPGYASCAGAVDAPDEDAYLRPRPFFEAMHRGASLGECFLFASPVVDWKIVLIGDPLMVVNFPSDPPSSLDLSVTSIPNNEVIRLVKEHLETSVAWLARQSNLTQNMVDKCYQSDNISEEIHLLSPLSDWNSAKSLESVQWLLNRSVSSWMSYILKTTGDTLSNWLETHDEKVSELLSDVIDSTEGDSVDESYVHDEGSWEYEFVYEHQRNTLENVHFRLQVSTDENFSSIVVGTGDESNSYEDITGWTYENELYGFIRLTSYGLSSNFSGRRVKFIAPEEFYLTRTNVYYVRWRALDESGNNLTDWNVDPSRMIIKR